VIQKLYDANRQARQNFVNWYSLCVHDGEIDPTLFWLAVKNCGFFSHLVDVCVCACACVYIDVLSRAVATGLISFPDHTIIPCVNAYSDTFF